MNKRLFAVSFGNGNSGVSRRSPTYAVWADDVEEVAWKAAVRHFPRELRSWVEENLEIYSNDEDFARATLDYGPYGETAFGAAYFICEAFRVNDAPRCPIYDIENM